MVWLAESLERVGGPPWVRGWSWEVVNTPPLLLVIQILTLHGLAGTGGLWVGKPSDTIINPSQVRPGPTSQSVNTQQYWQNIPGKTFNWPQSMFDGMGGATSFVCYLMRDQKLETIKIIGQIFYLKWWLEILLFGYFSPATYTFLSVLTHKICPQELNIWLKRQQTWPVTTHNWANWDIREPEIYCGLGA